MGGGQTNFLRSSGFHSLGASAGPQPPGPATAAMEVFHLVYDTGYARVYPEFQEPALGVVRLLFGEGGDGPEAGAPDTERAITDLQAPFGFSRCTLGVRG